MSKQKPGRKHRTPQKRVPRLPSLPRPREAAGVLAGGGLPLRGSLEQTATLLQHAKPDQLVEVVLPYLWVALADGRVPANVCVDACLTLRNAYGQLGVRAELLAVDLAVQPKGGGGGGIRYGSLTPSWSGTVWNGHCVLVLPDSERLVDATVEQFEEIREVGAGPVIGKVAMSTNEDSSMVEPGGQVMLRRGGLVLTYTVAGPDAVASIVQHPQAVAHADGHHRTGVNVASFTLVALRGEGVVGRAMQAPHPRLRALLRAVGDAPYEADEAGDVRFFLADRSGREQWLRLDEIPLPPSVPAAWPRP